MKSASIRLENHRLESIDVLELQELAEGGMEAHYRNLFETCQSLGSPDPPPISKMAFASNTFFLCADLTTGLGLSGDKLPLVKQGTLRVHLDFNEPVAESFNMVAFMVNVNLLSYTPGGMPIIASNVS